MAKILAQIPEPSEVYDTSNQRQINQGLNTLKNELNTSFQEDLKQEVERVSWYFVRYS